MTTLTPTEAAILEQCQNCKGLLEAKDFCSSCKGCGGWDNEEICITCDGEGNATEGNKVTLQYCPRCLLIYPAIEG